MTLTIDNKFCSRETVHTGTKRVEDKKIEYAVCLLAQGCRESSRLLKNAGCPHSYVPNVFVALLYDLGFDFRKEYVCPYSPGVPIQLRELTEENK